MKKQYQTSVRVSGQGKSAQQAFADGINCVQAAILKGNQNIILRIEPEDVQVVSANVQRRVEKFLFIFLPRKIAHYSVVLDVSVMVTILEIDKVIFEGAA
ncbi:hypothetical protein AwWohl_02320 [Gammaproteobacteria bacterium]|nr:hypothetical protein AwWohl_02320 [Gammaproteobacteria bacterium]